jgi:hypothetical protein
MPDFDHRFGSSVDFQESSVFKLQGISIGHGNRLRKIDEDVFALIRDQADAAAMARVKFKRDRACGALLRPLAGRSMSQRVMHRPPQYMK